MPRAVQAGVSSEALRAPVIPSMRSFGSRLISEPGSGVRLAHRQHDIEVGELAAASSSLSNALAKNTTSARACNGDQSALVFATPCQSSSTATLVMPASHRLVNNLEPFAPTRNRQCGGIGMNTGGVPGNFERRLIASSSAPCGFRYT